MIYDTIVCRSGTKNVCCIGFELYVVSIVIIDLCIHLSLIFHTRTQATVRRVMVPLLTFPFHMTFPDFLQFLMIQLTIRQIQMFQGSIFSVIN